MISLIWKHNGKEVGKKIYATLPINLFGEKTLALLSVQNDRMRENYLSSARSYSAILELPDMKGKGWVLEVKSTLAQGTIRLFGYINQIDLVKLEGDGVLFNISGAGCNLLRVQPAAFEADMVNWGHHKITDFSDNVLRYANY
jgi:hypothetical protein